MQSRLLDHLALWLMPGATRRWLQTLQQQVPNLSVQAMLQTLATRSGALSALAQLALHDPWKLPYAQRLEDHLNWAAMPGNKLLITDQLPSALQQLPDPPLILCVQGNPELLDMPAVSVVGTRHPSVEGQQIAYHWSHWLTWQGLNLVSGLARGIDACAHRGSLAAANEGASATTLAFLAQGMDRIYPPEHRQLAAELALQGALLSEYPLGTPPMKHHFPQRNRLITASSLGLVVIEAAERSGSLVSARLANEQGKEVMAVPGSIHNPRSAGCHLLIQQGAALVTRPQDILLCLQTELQQHLPLPEPARTPPPNALLTDDQQRIHACLTHQVQPLDQLLIQAQMDAATALAALQHLQLQGLVLQQAGGWCRNA